MSKKTLFDKDAHTKQKPNRNFLNLRIQILC